LTRLVDGEAMFVVSKHEKILHRGLSGGWHYHRDSAGRVMRDIPVKDRSSHSCDALSHGIAKIFRYQNEARFKMPDSKKKYAVASSVQPLFARGR